MIETVGIISNGIVIIAIGALYRKLNNQEKMLNDHVVTFTKEIANKPSFSHVDKQIEGAVKKQDHKAKPIQKEVSEIKERLFNHLLGSPCR